LWHTLLQHLRCLIQQSVPMACLTYYFYDVYHIHSTYNYVPLQYLTYNCCLPFGHIGSDNHFQMLHLPLCTHTSLSICFFSQDAGKSLQLHNTEFMGRTITVDPATESGKCL